MKFFAGITVYYTVYNYDKNVFMKLIRELSLFPFVVWYDVKQG